MGWNDEARCRHQIVRFCNVCWSPTKLEVQRGIRIVFKIEAEEHCKQLRRKAASLLDVDINNAHSTVGRNSTT